MVRGHWDGDEEARAIGEDIERLQREGAALNGIAILVRASFQMRAFEDRFITLGLPYRVIGGPRFYERQEIRDAMAYLKVTSPPTTTSPSSASSTCPSAASARPPSRRCTRSPGANPGR
jgi:DNA helicase II / ATP-dependent DNA helicase PcrA